MNQNNDSILPLGSIIVSKEGAIPLTYDESIRRKTN